MIDSLNSKLVNADSNSAFEETRNMSSTEFAKWFEHNVEANRGFPVKFWPYFKVAVKTMLRKV